MAKQNSKNGRIGELMELFERFENYDIGDIGMFDDFNLVLPYSDMSLPETEKWEDTNLKQRLP